MAETNGTFGWETLAPHDGGRRLMDPEKAHTVGAKVRIGGGARWHLFIDLYSEDAGWSILVLDEKLRPVTQAFGRRKSDVWAEVQTELKKRGLLVSEAVLQTGQGSHQRCEQVLPTAEHEPVPVSRRNGESSLDRARGRRPMSTTTRPTLDCSEPSSTYVTTMEVVGTLPITYNLGRSQRQSYRDWVAALDEAARDAAARARPATAQLFSLRCELRLYAPGQGSDLDNYVKPIQDALARHGLFGETEYVGSTMKGDERIDHLDLRRKRVGSREEAGVLAEVWALIA